MLLYNGKGVAHIPRPMLSVFITILTVVLVLVSLLLSLTVLMQRPKQEGLGAAFGGGMMDSLAGAHTTDVLQKATVWFAAIFFACAILLAMLKTRELAARDPGTVLEPPTAQETLPGSGPVPAISDLPAPAEKSPETPPKGDAEKPASTDSAPAKPAETPAPKPAPAKAAGGEAPKPAAPAKPAEKTAPTPAPAPAPEGGKKPE